MRGYRGTTPKTALSLSWAVLCFVLGLMLGSQCGCGEGEIEDAPDAAACGEEHQRCCDDGDGAPTQCAEGLQCGLGAPICTVEVW